MAIPPREAKSMLDELLAASADLLPQFAAGTAGPVIGFAVHEGFLLPGRLQGLQRH
jgi:hypothetical protein